MNEKVELKTSTGCQVSRWCVVLICHSPCLTGVLGGARAGRHPGRHHVRVQPVGGAWQSRLRPSTFQLLWRGGATGARAKQQQGQCGGHAYWAYLLRHHGRWPGSVRSSVRYAKYQFWSVTSQRGDTTMRLIQSINDGVTQSVKNGIIQSVKNGITQNGMIQSVRNGWSRV